MPKEFEACVKNGGRVRTKTLSKGRYIHICWLNGKSYVGEVKTKETSASKSPKTQIAKELESKENDEE